MHRSLVVDSPEIQLAFREACEAIGYAYAPSMLRFAPSIPTPVVVGTIKPVILLPQPIGEEVSSQQLTEILMHEVAHIVRRDPHCLFSAELGLHSVG